MLDNSFIVVLNMSITASCAAVVIFLLRMLLKKAPKWISYAMWSVVLLRSVFPFSFSSVFSLFRSLGAADTATANGMMRYIPESIGMSEMPMVNIGIPEVNHVVNESLPAATPYASVNPMQVIVFVAAILWLVGVAAMLVYSVISYAALKQRIATAVHIEDTVYESDRISTAFVCGFLKPRIYLPIGLPENSRRYVLAHERIHIRRRDYLIKPIAFLALSLHWFNPVLWAAYFLMSKDMEMSCDERALHSFGSDEKANYGMALLALSSGRRFIAGSPLAFGESGTRSRVKNVLSYKKPAFWMVMIAVIAGIAVGVSLLTNPKAPEKVDIPAALFTPAAPTASSSIAQTPSPSPTIAVPVILPAGVPEGFVINEVGATNAEVAAIFNMEMTIWPVNSFDGLFLIIYARQDWRGGTLLLAGVRPRGDTQPELYFIKDGSIVMRTRGSDAWSINYTHYQGETIVFGDSFAWDGSANVANHILATDEVIAEFENGETVSVPMKYEPGDVGIVKRGFICITPSTTWLKSLKIMRDGKVVADDKCERFFINDEDMPWHGTPESIRNRTHYVQANGASYNHDDKGVEEYFGGYPSVTVETPYKGETPRPNRLTYWPFTHESNTPTPIHPRIWHSNNGLYTKVDAKAGTTILAEVSKSAYSGEEGDSKVSNLPVLKVYWVDLSIKDDAACVSEGELVCPKKKGFYVLVLLTDYGYFSQMLRVT